MVSNYPLIQYVGQQLILGSRTPVHKGLRFFAPSPFPAVGGGGGERRKFQNDFHFFICKLNRILYKQWHKLFTVLHM